MENPIETLFFNLQIQSVLFFSHASRKKVQKNVLLNEKIRKFFRKLTPIYYSLEFPIDDFVLPKKFSFLHKLSFRMPSKPFSSASS